MKRWILLLASLVLIVTARCWNHSQIFVAGQIYFVDADCYSRMSRVKAVQEHPGTILRHHDFENWPVGTTPHTTMPLDWLIAGLALVVGSIDLTGAITPVLLAVATGAVLWKWSERFRFSTQIAVLLLFAVSPILVHGTVLGRPDHQALLIFLITAALATEQVARVFQPAAILNGLAWGLAIWTSLFEPVILLAVVTLAGLRDKQKKWPAWLSLGIVLLVALLVEHWRITSLPGGELFARWSKSIGELGRPGWFAPIFLNWLGWSALVVPWTLGWQIFKKRDLAVIPWTILLLVTYLLSVTMLRWGYFLALAFIFALPFVLEKIRNRWVMALFFLGFWPVATEWDRMLDSAKSEQTLEQIEDYRQLRQVSTHLDGGFLAPWWLSPPLAYWSGANGVAGSSHQSLPGISDTAEFYLSRFPERAREILQKRKVRWVIAYEPDRVLSTSSTLLNIPATRDALGVILYDTPRRAPGWLQLRFETPYFKLYEYTGGF